MGGMLWKAGIGIAAVILVAAVGALLWWRVPKWQMQSIAVEDQKALADIEDNFRKTIGQALGTVAQVLGGIAVLIGAGVAYLQLLEQHQASHDLLISNRVSKGFEQLGSDKIEVRLGGIYARPGWRVWPVRLDEDWNFRLWVVAGRGPFQAAVVASCDPAAPRTGCAAWDETGVCRPPAG